MRRKLRRLRPDSEVNLVVADMVFSLLRQLLCSSLDRFADANIGAAAANVSAHRFLDVLVGGFPAALEQRYSAHDLTALAVAALHNVLSHPDVLNHAAHAIFSDALDGHNRTIADQRNRNHARASRDF